MKRGNKLITTFSPEPLLLLPATFYWRILQAAINDVAGLITLDGTEERTTHENAYVRGVVLLSSVLGGFCQPGAEKHLIYLKLCDIEPILANHEPDGLGYIHPYRPQIDSFIHPFVENVALTLIHQRMKAIPIRNHGLRPIQRDTSLTPIKQIATGEDGDPDKQEKYLRKLIRGYFRDLTRHENLPTVLNLHTYIGVSRHLLSWMYEPDVAHYLMGNLPSKPMVKDQLDEPDLLSKLRSFNYPGTN